MASIGDYDQVARDDAVLRLRASGMPFTKIAPSLGLASREAARLAFRRARVRALDPRPRRPRPSPAMVAWAAGFFDGEGCIFGYERVERGHGRFSFGLVVGQTVEAPLRTLHRYWGGSVGHRPQRGTHSEQWSWQVRGRDAADFLRDVLPHLQVKTASARVALPCLFRTHKRGVPFTQAEVIERRAAIAFLHADKRRGRAEPSRR